MAKIITNLGYDCPNCGKQVTVISSSANPPINDDFFFSECECGYRRSVPRGDLQSLELWWEEKAA
jgi:hypothetical protein